MRPIGYYVHHRGRGHLDRARRIAGHLRRPCTLIGTLSDVDGGDLQVVQLPDDADGERSSSARGEDMPHAFHFAPLDFPRVRERMAAVAAWVAREKPALVVVDVSVEVALFCHLLSVPTVFIRLAGDRSDQAHLEAFRAARTIVAPFPSSFEHAATPAWVRQKTIYAGFLHEAPTDGPAIVTPKSVGVVLGAGGTRLSAGDMIAAAHATPDRTWHVYGDISTTGESLPGNLTLHGFVDDIDVQIAPIDILIGEGGDGVVSLAVRHAKRFICFPQTRPFDEQLVKARGLQERGAALVRLEWPAPHDWSALLELASRLDPKAIRQLDSAHSLRTAVAAIEQVADAYDPHRP